MNQTKELLLFVATSIVAAGTNVIATGKVWEGIAILVVGAIVFIGRGFYKKYLEGKK